MQFFFRGLLVAAITYFFKPGHNNHGLIFTVVIVGLLRAVETVGLLRAILFMGLIRAVGSMGLLRGVSSFRQSWAVLFVDHNGPLIGRI